MSAGSCWACSPSPRPSRPLRPWPQLYSVPALVKANEWYVLAATSTTETDATVGEALFSRAVGGVINDVVAAAALQEEVGTLRNDDVSKQSIRRGRLISADELDKAIPAMQEYTLGSVSKFFSTRFQPPT